MFARAVGHSFPTGTRATRPEGGYFLWVELPEGSDALHIHQLIYPRLVRKVFHDDESRRMLMRNNRTSPYLWGFTLLTVVPATLFWSNTPLLMAFCGLFVISYVMAYIAIVRFKVPRWLRR